MLNADFQERVSRTRARKGVRDAVEYFVPTEYSTYYKREKQVECKSIKARNKEPRYR